MEFFVNRAKIDEETLKPAEPGEDGVMPENHKNYDLNYKLWCSISACVDEDNPCFRSVEMNQGKGILAYTEWEEFAKGATKTCIVEYWRRLTEMRRDAASGESFAD